MKSAGTAKSARIKVSNKLIEWAELIFVMEKDHKRRILEFPEEILIGKKIIVLDIPDEYQYMEEELISQLEDSVGYYLKDEG